jgi:acetyl-CoA synthetase
VILEGDRETSDELMKELRNHVREEIGPTFRPDQVVAVDDLPKTRSGKIMRRILKKIAEGEQDVGDTTTLADPSVVDDIQQQATAQR